MSTENVSQQQRVERWQGFNGEYANDHARGPNDPVFKNILSLAGPYLNDQVRALDFGCNIGELAGLIQENLSVQIEGCDINPSAIETAQKNYPGLHFFVEGDPSKIQQKYIFVFLIEVLEHISNRETFLKNMRESVLDDGGYLLVVVPNHWAVLPRLAAFLTGRKFAFDPTHQIEFNFFSMRSLAKETGFEIINLYTKPLAIPGLQKISQQLKENMSAGWFGRHIYCLLRKK